MNRRKLSRDLEKGNSWIVANRGRGKCEEKKITKISWLLRNNNEIEQNIVREIEGEKRKKQNWKKVLNKEEESFGKLKKVYFLTFHSHSS